MREKLSDQKREEKIFFSNMAKFRRGLFFFFCIDLIVLSFIFAQVRQSPKNLKEKYRKWLEEQVVYIITPKEKDVFLQLQTDREKDVFIEAFWKHRDPTPNTPRNEFEEEHFKRIDYANNWFGKDSPGPGWRTARGRIYITLGPPNSVERYENLSEIYPVIIWFYDGMMEYGLPNSFNVVFFKKGSIGEYRLYSPIKYGPQNLLIHYYGDMTEYTEAYYKLQEIEPSIAQISLSLLPGEAVQILSPSLASEVLISSKIPSAPYKKVKDSYAEKLLKYKDTVELEYTANYIENDSLVRVIRDRSGIFFVHYLIEPKRLSFEQYQNRFQSNLEINGQISDPKGNMIYQFERTIPIEFNSNQMDSIRNKLFSYQDMFPLAAGKYTFSSLMKNTVSKEFTSVEEEITIPEKSGLRMSSLVLANRVNDNSQYKGKNKPFLIGDKQLIPSPRNDFAKKDTLYVYFQIQGLTPALKEKGSLEFSIIKEGEKVYSSEKKIKDYPDPANIIEQFPLVDFPPAYYDIRISLQNGDRTELLSQSAPFYISHLLYLSRPWVVSMPVASSEDPVTINILGNQFLKKGEEAKALSLLEEAYNKNPTSQKFAFDLSRVLFKAKEFQRIKQIASPFLQDQKKFAFLQIVGQSCQALGEYSQAVAYYKEYLAHFGTNIPVLNSIGDCYYRLGIYDEALTAWEKSLKINPAQERIKKLVMSIKK